MQGFAVETDPENNVDSGNMRPFFIVGFIYFLFMF